MTDDILKKLSRMTVSKQPLLSQVKVDGLAYPTFTNSITLIEFKNGQFSKDTRIDSRTKKQIEKGVGLPDISGAYPDISRVKPNPKNTPDNFYTVTYKLSELMKQLREVKKKIVNLKRNDLKSVFFHYENKCFEAVTPTVIFGEHDVLFTYNNLYDTLMVMKLAGVKGDVAITFSLKPHTPVIIEHELIGAVVAPIRTMCRK